MVAAPILCKKFTSKPSVFAPAALLREARRQKGLGTSEVPSVCILDPDGDLVRQLRQRGAAKPFADWPCYHTELYTFELAGQSVGIVGCVVGASWTTDAPFRETAEAIDDARSRGILAVEMEAAALYAFAAAAGVRVLCLAHVTNTMGQGGDDFEKGEQDGTRDALAVLGAIIGALHPR